MDTSQITAPAPLGTGLVSPVATSRTVVTEQVPDLSLLAVAPTTVDLSSAGRFLSLASLFQKKTLDLQTSVRADADSAKALADAATAAAALAGAFDELQTSAVDSNGLPTAALDGQSLQLQFFQQLGGAPDDAEASLAAVGLAFTEATGTASRRLTVDETMLEDAFRQDPAATSALLERAASALVGVVGTQLPAQAAAPLPFATPQEVAPAPSYPTAQPASYTDNIFLQNLVTENLRNDAAPPVALAELVGDKVFPVQANLIAAPADEPGVQALAEPDIPASAAVSVAQEARVLAQQLQAEREAARELDEKIAGASDAVRAALADDIAQRDASRAARLDRESGAAERRADPAVTAAAALDRFARPADAVRAATTAHSIAESQNTVQDRMPQPPAVPAPDQAQLAARDPAIAAAIAAYNVGTGPFAAQHGKPEIQPPKLKPVAPVAAVTKVEAAGALGTPGGGSAPLQ